MDLHNGKVVRASMGAIFHVPVEIDVPLDVAAGALRAHRLPGPRRASRLRRPAFREFDCYIFGNEGRGLPRERSCSRWGRSRSRLPGTGAIESLNVAATVNICLYELHRDQR